MGLLFVQEKKPIGGAKAGKSGEGALGQWEEASDFLAFFCLLFWGNAKKVGGVWGKAPFSRGSRLWKDKLCLPAVGKPAFIAFQGKKV